MVDSGGVCVCAAKIPPISISLFPYKSLGDSEYDKATNVVQPHFRDETMFEDLTRPVASHPVNGIARMKTHVGLLS